MREHDNSMANINSEWYADWFDDYYLKVYAHRSLTAGKNEVVFVVKELKIEPEHVVLDLCCGAGRHLAHLHAAGLKNLTGMDLSPQLLAVARKRLPSDVALVRGDMRQLPFQNKTFERILCFFTSFGYFQSDQMNFGVLQEMARNLSSSGRAMLDLIGPAAIENLVPESEKEVDGLVIREKRFFDSRKQRINKEITIIDNDLSRSYSESVRYYSADELANMFAGAGLAIDCLFGDFTGSRFSAHSSRTIVMFSHARGN